MTVFSKLVCLLVHHISPWYCTILNFTFKAVYSYRMNVFVTGFVAVWKS
jgi:hypothetical protein